MESGVAVVGSSFMDLVHMVHNLPKSGETIFARQYCHEGLGGKGNNQAAMVSKLMHASSNGAQDSKCLFITGVGGDGFSQSMLDSFHKHFDSVDQTVFQFKETTTGRAMINVDDQGRNSIVLIRGANELLSKTHVDQCWSLIEQSTRVLVTQNEIPFETTVHALKRAKESQMLTVFNTAPAPKPSDLHGDVIQYVDVLCPNETEAISIIGHSEFAEKQELTVEDGQHIAKTLYEKYVKENSACSHVQIVVTLGEKGAVAYMNENFSLSNRDQGERILAHFPLTEKKVVVDTTGAGDAFVGSLAYFLSKNIRLQDAIPMSNIVASDSVTKFGSQASFSGDFQF